MPRKSYKPEEIVARLRPIEVLASQGQSMAEAIPTYSSALDGAAIAFTPVSRSAT